MESSQGPENQRKAADLTGGIALPWQRPGSSGTPEAGDAAAGPLEIEVLQGEFPEIENLSLVSELKEVRCYQGVDSTGKALVVHDFPGAFRGVSGSDTDGYPPDKEAALALKCRSVIGVEACVEIDGRKVVVTELPEGQALSDWRAQENLAPGRVLAVGKAICKAVARVHAAGFSHRCLNPSAIYVDEQDEVRIVGLGLAKLFYSKWRAEIAQREQEDSGSEIEIADYLAPEVRKQGLHAGDHRSDIWSLGAILYDLCMGHPPKGFLFDMSSSSIEVSPDYATSLLRAMENNPRQRTDSVARLIDQLDGLEKPPPAPEPECEPEPEKKPRSAKKGGKIASSPVASAAATAEGGRRYSAFDGLLSQCGGPVLLGFVALGLVVGGFFAVQTVLRLQDWKRSEFSNDTGGFLAKVRKARELAGVGRYFESLELVREVAAEAEVNRGLLEAMTEVLVHTAHYEAAIGILDNYMERGDTRAPGVAELVAEWNLTRDRFRSFLAAMEGAEAAHEERNAYLEYEALSRARELIPADEEAGRRLERNPVHVYADALRKLGQLKTENPRQKNWRYHLWVRRGLVRLDLSGNEQLQTIAALKGIHFTELDLSGTGVSDLDPLAGSDLEVLRLDEAPVKSLEALSGLPLQVLTFENCALHNATLPPFLEDVRVLRGDIGGERVARVGQPVAGWFWENELGMQFRPVGKGEVLVSVWETRALDFQKYLNEKRRGQSQLQTRPGMVVTGVSCREAEEFCEWLTARDRKRGILGFTQSYRLPTDFEWSLAAARYENPLLTPGARTRREQGGSAAAAEDREMILESSEGIAPELGNGAGSGPDEVGRRLSWHGFYDLKGNAWEWCRDVLGEKGGERIVRGGEGLEVRNVVPASSREFDVGFRVVLEAAPPPDYGALRSLVSKGRWDKAHDLALQRAIGDVVPAVREAGRAYLELHHMIDGGESIFPDSVVGVDRFEGRRYYAARLPLSWGEAREFAEALGGHLVTITSAEEHRWITEALLRDSGDESFWIGAAVRPGAGSWSWVTREPWIFSRTKVKGAKDTTRALVLAPAGAAGSSQSDETEGGEGMEAGGFWIADDSEEAHSFIVEWEPRETAESLAGAPRG